MAPPGRHPHDDTDPRKLRSRARLLDAATTLLKSGGVQAVTVDAVTRLSKVARTTLYRNFDNSADLLAATFERLVPQVAPPPPTGPLRDQLIELLTRQSTLIDEAPMQLTTLAWLAMGPQHPSDQPRTFATLRDRVIQQYRQPFDELLGNPEIHDELGDFDTTLALAQLIGPMVFAKLTGLRAFTREDCSHLVDDFLTARRTSQRPR
ncbi:TetR/AcrR family transcriptional regulator [Nocardia huaxiensis]|uniref:TetR/AcrR family transcriptional regulator n=1 Tax=Nocardia huaxiensis TaxID=2755382 RepID=A0A7D6ZCQ1_9NOCA|nr:TetR/AcrR family transcriptional regulator [Nocardia huaxiensis]QLY30538.1 TetR/AcrR family transcriptional regulator [Nocardia huaxiensis]UFS95860.1 TetR/AcrR family transcriptional regulator [Nocardia huaxiensis]